MENEFFKMQDFPTQVEGETFSKTVLVYDEGENDFCELGYYDFVKEEWNVFGDMSMRLICWCYPPNPSEFINSQKLKHEIHNGYRES